MRKLSRKHDSVDISRTCASNAALLMAGGARNVVEDWSQAVAAGNLPLVGDELPFEYPPALGNDPGLVGRCSNGQIQREHEGSKD
jgi:hypothetical protein